MFHAFASHLVPQLDLPAVQASPCIRDRYLVHMAGEFLGGETHECGP